ncbi:hypothetical protein [Agave yellow streak virus Jalisco 1]|uniref:Uncharacterized protein n=1 Tax=Agave yellow streak virus Jalisco 1 TaxID=3142681 RepID=A0A1X9ZMU0_9VIRU|nr:hypothetical protein [Agave tequilana leaf virus]ARS73024.1 hypothetical protein [Agave tequilana leaf virus]
MYPSVAKRYSVNSLVQHHTDLIVYGISLEVGLEYLLRSEKFLAETELIPDFIEWHHRTQKYRYFTVGVESEVTLKYNPNEVLSTIEFIEVKNSNLLSLVGFVGNTNLVHVNFSGGFIHSRRGRIRTNITLGSYMGLIKRIEGCVCYALADE